MNVKSWWISDVRRLYKSITKLNYCGKPFVPSEYSTWGSFESNKFSFTTQYIHTHDTPNPCSFDFCMWPTYFFQWMCLELYLKCWNSFLNDYNYEMIHKIIFFYSKTCLNWTTNKKSHNDNVGNVLLIL
jgi:hypothetical protein